ncbi:hypothetical protein AQ744_03455 [Burkholderia pseudomallei]|nr:hypothetical protein AQ744_03455 [Burkholderia pseudomallei]
MGDNPTLGLCDTNGKMAVWSVNGMVDIGFSNSRANVDLNNSVRSADRPAHIHHLHAEVRRVTIK